MVAYVLLIRPNEGPDSCPGLGWSRVKFASSVLGPVKWLVKWREYVVQVGINPTYYWEPPYPTAYSLYQGYLNLFSEEFLKASAAGNFRGYSKFCEVRSHFRRWMAAFAVLLTGPLKRLKTHIVEALTVFIIKDSFDDNREHMFSGNKCFA